MRQGYDSLLLLIKNMGYFSGLRATTKPGETAENPSHLQHPTVGDYIMAQYMKTHGTALDEGLLIKHLMDGTYGDYRYHPYEAGMFDPHKPAGNDTDQNNATRKACRRITTAFGTRAIAEVGTRTDIDHLGHRIGGEFDALLLFIVQEMETHGITVDLDPCLVIYEDPVLKVLYQTLMEVRCPAPNGAGRRPQYGEYRQGYRYPNLGENAAILPRKKGTLLLQLLYTFFKNGQKETDEKISAQANITWQTATTAHRIKTLLNSWQGEEAPRCIETAAKYMDARDIPDCDTMRQDPDIQQLSITISAWAINQYDTYIEEKSDIQKLILEKITAFLLFASEHIGVRGVGPKEMARKILENEKLLQDFMHSVIISPTGYPTKTRVTIVRADSIIQQIEAAVQNKKTAKRRRSAAHSQWTISNATLTSQQTIGTVANALEETANRHTGPHYPGGAETPDPAVPPLVRTIYGIASAYETAHPAQTWYVDEYLDD